MRCRSGDDWLEREAKEVAAWALLPLLLLRLRREERVGVAGVEEKKQEAGRRAVDVVNGRA